MTIKLRLIALILTGFLHMPNAYAEILSAPDLQIVTEELKEADAKTLVIFDIDDTLVVGKDLALKTPYKQELISEKIDAVNNQCKSMFLTGFIWSDYQTELIDKQALSILKDLRKRKIDTIALTSGCTGRQGNAQQAENHRIQKLKKLGIDLSWSFKKAGPFTFTDLETCGKFPMYKNGVGFSCYLPKDEILSALFDELGYEPEHIIHIDDNESHLEHVEEFCTANDISYTGFHYTYAEDHVPPLNEERADFQFKMLKEKYTWYDDKKADKALALK